MTDEPTGLQVVDLSVVYDGTTRAVDSVSVDVAPGTVLALLGASGSGKSSLLRAVAGLVRPVSGRVCWDGRDVTEVPVHRRGFGLMFQDGQLFPHRSVGGNVGYALNKMSRRERQARVGELLDLVGLSGYEDRRVSEISGGQAQRVALARCVAADPALLLLDEPLSSLDKSLRERLASDIRAMVRGSGMSAVHVTHDTDEAFAIADLVGVMEAGRLVRLGTPEVLWSRPGAAAVADLLGRGPVLSPQQCRQWFGVEVASSVALADALVEVEGDDGLEVEVVARGFRRGVHRIEVVLPDGRSASGVAAGSGDAGGVTRVGLRPEGLVALPDTA